MSLDPFLAVVPDLFLPDRDDLLNAVDGVVTRVKRFSAVAGRDRDEEARLADLEAPGAVHDSNAGDCEPGTDLVGDLLHLLNRHLRVGVVFEVPHAPAEVLVADD